MTTKEFEIQLALGTLTDNMKLKLAIDKRTSKRILTILSTNKYWRVRWRVAKNLNTPVEVLTKLLEDKHWLVKGRAMRKRTEQDKT